MPDDLSLRSDLRSLTTAERELCARYPLQPHIPYAVVNKTLLCDGLAFVSIVVDSEIAPFQRGGGFAILWK